MAKQFTSVWTREPRQPRPSGLSRDQIVAAALEILGTEGLEALSMRKLGAKLGAGATSLYWHVANKSELLELALDEIWGVVDDADLDGAATLRELLTTFAYNLRSALLAHPWVASLIGQIPSIGPKAFQLSERLRHAFLDAGFQGMDVYLASGTVTNFVLGHTLPVIAMKNAYGDELVVGGIEQTLDKIAAAYPEMLADYRAAIPTDPQVISAMGFDFGLLCVLDGLETRLRAPSGAHDREQRTEPRAR
ncbi:TetR/AcrR family transcriptional regulator C-terminal domain-containing protein [Nocardia brevicatena]|uniref:TetR/AcrR family transcriptional regulator C-terminal domain-containing protein n=1 Tax=Nocardia brevicatena TaxID=37327 RepID=UPI0002D87F4B|nr:TetR/AcrR family transcriptional regulator C-terminal domain-containing protein [Nocardia brevicatena]